MAIENIETQNEDIGQQSPHQMTHCNVTVICPNQSVIKLSSINCNEQISILKASLTDYIETCYISTYYFTQTYNNIPLNDYSEVGSALLEYLSNSDNNEVDGTDSLIELHLKIVYDTYDIKKTRYHLKRIKDILFNPPIISGGNRFQNNPTIKTADKVMEDIQNEEICYPTYDEILSTSETALSKFYEEALNRVGNSLSNIGVTASTFSKSVLTLTLSEWNPPPITRQLQGDLLYIQVVVPEGTYQLTAYAKGFFINRSSGNAFDPRPASTSRLNHTLLELLIELSPTVRDAWQNHCACVQSIRETEGIAGVMTKYISPLEAVKTHFDAGRGDSVCPPQWNFPNFNDKQIHTKDSWRTIIDVCDTFGITDEKGPVREWNDEYQSIQDLPHANLTDKITRSRLIHRTTMEFVESSRQAVIGILLGHITPLNPMDPPNTQVFVYNNIFFSKAIDTHETFKLCVGDDACRKVAGQDIKNQRILQSLGIEGLSGVMSAIIDYRGERIVAQTIIPGVLSGNGGARLMYGVMEFGKRLSCKTAALQLMERVGKALRMTIRQVPSIPISVSKEYPSPPVQPSIETIQGTISETAPVQEASSIKTDSFDEVAPMDSPSIPHIGPIEGKILQGIDGRLYALEMIRLTPRDANYVRKPVIAPPAEGEDSNSESSRTLEGLGTGLIPEEKLAYCDANIAASYVLRYELIQIYLQRKALEKRREIIAKESTKTSSEITSTEEKIDDTIEEKEKLINSEDISQDVSSLVTNEEKIKTSTELQKELSEATIDSVEFDFNPNVFVPHPEKKEEYIQSDIDESVVLKDEEVVREISTFLYNQIIPSFMLEVRQSEVTVMGGEGLVEAIHSRGINLRYLGRLAELAIAEEAEDTAMSTLGKQRIHIMPSYFLELLEMEMIARALRKVLNAKLRDDPAVLAAPSFMIVSALNYIFGGLAENPSENGGKPSVETENLDNKTISKSNLIENIDGESKHKKKKKNKHKIMTGDSDGNAHGSDVIHTPGAELNRTEFLNQIINAVKSQYLYDLTLVASISTQSDSANTESVKYFLTGRIPRVTFLRRVCMLLGLRVSTRDYAYHTMTPFTVDDILGLNPRIKVSTAIETGVVPEAMALLATSRRLTTQGQYTAAFEVAHEASIWIQDCVGPVHKDYRAALDELTSVCLSAGEFDQALSTATKNLTLSVQIDGLDSPETAQLHIRLATIYLGLVSQLKETVKSVSTSPSEATKIETESNAKELDAGAGSSEKDQESQIAERPPGGVAGIVRRAALNHIFAARYLVELAGGPRHPDLASIYLKLGLFLADEGRFRAGALCLVAQVKLRLTDLVRYASASALVAECLFKGGFLQQAADEQRQVYRVTIELFGSDDSRVAEAKSRLKTYLHAIGDAQARRKDVLANQQVTQALAFANQGFAKQIASLKISDDIRDDVRENTSAILNENSHLDKKKLNSKSGGGKKGKK